MLHSVTLAVFRNKDFGNSGMSTGSELFFILSSSSTKKCFMLFQTATTSMHVVWSRLKKLTDLITLFIARRSRWSQGGNSPARYAWPPPYLAVTFAVPWWKRVVKTLTASLCHVLPPFPKRTRFPLSESFPFLGGGRCTPILETSRAHEITGHR